MPALKNPKHELFAQEVAKGTALERAYAMAGYKPDPKNAARLTKNDAVRTRIDEILTLAAEKAGVTVQAVLEELAKIGFSNIADFVDVSGDMPSIALNGVGRDKLSALSEITSETVFERNGKSGKPTEVRRVKIKLWDKRAALVDLGRHLGMFKDKVEMTGANGGPLETKDVSARDRIASRIAGISARTRTGGDTGQSK